MEKENRQFLPVPIMNIFLKNINFDRLCLHLEHFS